MSMHTEPKNKPRPWNEAYIHIYIDNSNLWIQGQKTYAEKKKLETSWDPTWRFDVGRLRDILINEASLTAQQKRYPLRVTLYGSTPPPVDTVWKAIESYDIFVRTFPRSSWTGREKQVDSAIIADSVADASKAYYCNLGGVFMIVSGDRDLRTAAQKIVEFDLPMHVWAWQNALAKAYMIEQQDPKPIVHTLDGYLDRIGFRETTFRVDRNSISPHSAVVLDPLAKADVIENLVAHLTTPMYRYEYGTRREGASSNDLVIIPVFARQMSDTNLTDLFVHIQEKLQKHGLTVITHVVYLQRYLSDLHTDLPLAISNKFGEGLQEEKLAIDWMNGDEDDLDEEDEEEPDEKLRQEAKEEKNEEENEGFTRVDYRYEKKREYVKKTEQRARRRCDWRLYCQRGLNCNFGHTDEEKRNFQTYGTKGTVKYKLCKNNDCIRGARCSFAHGVAELFCPTCGKRGQHEMANCGERSRN